MKLVTLFWFLLLTALPVNASVVVIAQMDDSQVLLVDSKTFH